MRPESEILRLLAGMAGITTALAALPALALAQGGLRADFNGDGFDDLAVQVAKEDIGSMGNAGKVNVIYGTAGGLSGEDVAKPDAGQMHIVYGTGNGLTATRNQIWNQNTPGIEDVAETGDLFGGNYQCPC